MEKVNKLTIGHFCIKYRIMFRIEEITLDIEQHNINCLFNECIFVQLNVQFVYSLTSNCVILGSSREKKEEVEREKHARTLQ